MLPLRSPHLPGLLALLVGLGGCHHRDIDASADVAPDLERIQDTSETATGSAHSVSVGKLFILPLSKAALASPKLAFQRFETTSPLLAVLGGFQPAKCISVEPIPGQATKNDDEEHRVRVIFKGCRGPYGIRNLRGSVDASYVRSEGSSLLIQVRSGDGDNGTQALEANNHPASYDADVLVSGDDVRRDLLWHGHWSGVSLKGHHISQETNLSILFSLDDSGQTCADISGSTVGQVEKRGLRTLIDSFRACANSCPSGTLTGIAQPSGALFSLLFDGTSTATVRTPRGHSIEVPLGCLEEE